LLKGAETISDNELFILLRDVVVRDFIPGALIIGANKGSTTGDGDSTDPTFKMLLSDSQFTKWNKIFVEPVPSIYSELTKNVEKTGALHAYTVNAAVTTTESRVFMYCWKLGNDGNVDYNAFSILGLKAHSWIAGTCSLNKQRLFSQYDFSFLS
jgi:hypothetical protein